MAMLLTCNFKGTNDKAELSRERALDVNKVD